MNRKRIFLMICLLSFLILTSSLTAAAALRAQIEIENLPEEETAAEEEIQIVRNAEDGGAEQPEPAVSAEEPAAEEPAAAVPAPGVPVPQAPRGSTPSREIGFYWTPAENAEHYEVHWSNDQGNEFTLELAGDDWTCRSGRCIIYEELPINDNYKWTVTAVNESGSAASEELSFSVLANIPAPTAYLPNTVLGNQKPLTFQWDDVRANADHRPLVAAAGMLFARLHHVPQPDLLRHGPAPFFHALHLLYGITRNFSMSIPCIAFSASYCTRNY